MSEISEMMLDGTLCQCCGVLMIEEGEEECGHPISCETCQEDEKPKVKTKKRKGN